MAETTKTSVTILYQKEGTQPPIFVVGSFSEPAWEPIELDPTTVDGQFRFSKTFQVIPGTYQYKFRIGYGDWWVCDESQQTEYDASGFRNNVLVVKPEEKKPSPVAAAIAGPTVPQTLSLDNVDDSSEDGNQTTVGTTPASEVVESDFHEPVKSDTSTPKPKAEAYASPTSKPTQKPTAIDPSEEWEVLSKDEGKVEAKSDEQAFGGIFGSITSMLCGKRRKTTALLLTAVIIPYLAWTLTAS